MLHFLRCSNTTVYVQKKVNSLVLPKRQALGNVTLFLPLFLIQVSSVQKCSAEFSVHGDTAILHGYPVFKLPADRSYSQHRLVSSEQQVLTHV